MPETSKVYFNILALSKAFRESDASRVNPTLEYWGTVAALAQAQQLSMISSHLSEISKSLKVICDAKKEA